MTESTDQNSRLMRSFLTTWKILIPAGTLLFAYLGYRYMIEKDAPLIQIVGHPQLIGVWWGSKPIRIQQKPQMNLPENSIKNPLPIYVEPETLLTQIKLTNTGQRIANIIGYAYCDRVSFEPILRTKLEHLIATDTTWDAETMEQILEMPRNDTMALKFKQGLYGLDGLSMILHYLILYEDDGQIYDTYYWASYRLASEYKDRVQDYFIYQEDQRSYHTYTREESSIIKEVFAQRMKLISK